MKHVTFEQILKCKTIPDRKDGGAWQQQYRSLQTEYIKVQCEVAGGQLVLKKLL